MYGMSKYSGSMSIIDSDGNVAFEREFTQDEVVEILLKEMEKVGGRPVGTMLGFPVRVTKEPAGSPLPARRVAKKDEDAGSGHACCGSKGSRHKKGCANAGTSAAGRKAAGKGGAGKFSEPTYHAIKTLQTKDMTATEISRSKGFDHAEVVRIMESGSYGEYMKS